MQQKLKTIADALATLNNGKVYHYQAPDINKAPYIVWAEDDRVDLTAGNTHAEKAWQGTIDLYTHKEFDNLADQIEAKLEEIGCSWYLDGVTYEEEADLIHYYWVFTYA